MEGFPSALIIRLAGKIRLTHGPYITERGSIGGGRIGADYDCLVSIAMA